MNLRDSLDVNWETDLDLVTKAHVKLWSGRTYRLRTWTIHDLDRDYIEVWSNTLGASVSYSVESNQSKAKCIEEMLVMEIKQYELEKNEQN